MAIPSLLGLTRSSSKGVVLARFGKSSANDRYLRSPAGWSRREADVANRGYGSRNLGGGNSTRTRRSTVMRLCGPRGHLLAFRKAAACASLVTGAGNGHSQAALVNFSQPLNNRLLSKQCSTSAPTPNCKLLGRATAGRLLAANTTVPISQTLLE